MLVLTSLAAGLLASTTLASPTTDATNDIDLFTNHTDLKTSSPALHGRKLSHEERCNEIVRSLNEALVLRTPACGLNATGHPTWDCGLTDEKWKHYYPRIELEASKSAASAYAAAQTMTNTYIPPSSTSDHSTPHHLKPSAGTSTKAAVKANPRAVMKVTTSLPETAMRGRLL